MRATFLVILLLPLVAVAKTKETKTVAAVKDTKGAVLVGEACAPGRFAASLKKYIEAQLEKYSDVPEAELKKLLSTKTRERYELELLAPAVLPEAFPFLANRMLCFLLLQEVSAENMKNWNGCVEDFYEKRTVALVQEINACYEASIKK